MITKEELLKNLEEKFPDDSYMKDALKRFIINYDGKYEGECSVSISKEGVDHIKAWEFWGMFYALGSFQCIGIKTKSARLSDGDLIVYIEKE